MKTRILLTVCCILTSVTMSLAKAEPDPEKTCYYVDLNQADGSQIITLPGFDLCLKYYDQYAQTSHLPILLRNWQLDTLSFQLLSKEFGNNYYTFDLEALGANQELEVYSLIYKNETGKNQTVKFRVVPKEKEEIILCIESTPISSNCGKLEGNLIEFKGNIQGGTPPYTVTWQVMEENNEIPLYQERTDEVTHTGSTPTIQVDITPTYIVKMEVTDSCQGASKQMLTVTCEEDFVHPHNIFVTPKEKIIKQPSVELPH